MSERCDHVLQGHIWKAACGQRRFNLRSHSIRQCRSLMLGSWSSSCCGRMCSSSVASSSPCCSALHSHLILHSGLQIVHVCIRHCIVPRNRSVTPSVWGGECFRTEGCQPGRRWAMYASSVCGRTIACVHQRSWGAIRSSPVCFPSMQRAVRVRVRLHAVENSLTLLLLTYVLLGPGAGPKKAQHAAPIKPLTSMSAHCAARDERRAVVVKSWDCFLPILKRDAPASAERRRKRVRDALLASKANASE